MTARAGGKTRRRVAILQLTFVARIGTMRKRRQKGRRFQNNGDMIAKHIIPVVVMVALTGAQVEAQTPRQPAPSTRKVEKAKAAKPHCALPQATNACAAGGAPQPVPLNGPDGLAQEAKAEWIFQEPPKNALPFQNDLSPKKTPLGGLVGLKFPF